MGLELHDGRITGSSGIAKAGLTLGIIGTGLAVLGNNGNGLFGNGLFGGGSKDEQIAELKAMRYTDQIGIDLYKSIIEQSNAEDAKLAAFQKEAYGYIIDLDKKVALAEQAQVLNREYDAMARDYMFTIMNNKIDCCCDKSKMQMDFNKQLGDLTAASIISYFNSNFLPGRLYLPASSVAPATTAA